MGKIASWSYLNNKFSSSGSPSNKCPQKEDIEATGKINISGGYDSNQLVEESGCSAKQLAIVTIQNYAFSFEVKYQSQLIVIGQQITIEVGSTVTLTGTNRTTLAMTVNWSSTNSSIALVKSSSNTSFQQEVSQSIPSNQTKTFQIYAVGTGSCDCEFK